MGTAGTGKSYFIKSIQNRLRDIAEIGNESPLLLLAPTGVAAFNINGRTIHSTLSIPIKADSNHINITGKKLKQLQSKLKNVKYFIIDEKVWWEGECLA